MTSINITTRDTCVVRTKPFDSCFRLLNAHLRVQGHFNAISRPLLLLLVLLQIVEPCRVQTSVYNCSTKFRVENSISISFFRVVTFFHPLRKKLLTDGKKEFFTDFAERQIGMNIKKPVFDEKSNTPFLCAAKTVALKSGLKEKSSF